jgi:hypothetical protein
MDEEYADAKSGQKGQKLGTKGQKVGEIDADVDNIEV